MADVARTLWLGGGGGGLPGSSLPGKRLCWRQRGGFKTLIVYLSAGEPSPPSAPSLGCCGVAPRKTGREGGREKREGRRKEPSAFKGPVQSIMISTGLFMAATACIPQALFGPLFLPGSSFGFEQNFDTAVGNSAD